MNQDQTIIFVCEHGAAKSILAATYFNHLAAEMGLGLRAVARGTNPEPELSPQVRKGLSEDGLSPTESTPQKLTGADVQSARKIIAFCDLPPVYQSQANVERWDDIPPVSENYATSRDVMVDRIRQMLYKDEFLG